MVYELNWTDQTIGTFFRQIGNATGIFEMVLFFEFMLIVIAGSVANKKSTGISNVVTWASVSSFVTLLSATLLALGGFIEMITVILWLVGTVVIFVVTELGTKLIKSSDNLV